MKKTGNIMVLVVAVLTAVMVLSASSAFAGPPCNGKLITIVVQNSLGETLSRVNSKQAHYITSRQESGKCGAALSQGSFTESNMNYDNNSVGNNQQATATVCVSDTTQNIDTLHTQWLRPNGTKIYCEKKQSNICVSAASQFRCTISSSTLTPAGTDSKAPIQ